MAGSIKLNGKTILRLKNSLLLLIYEELAALIIEKKLSLNEPLINFMAELDQDTNMSIYAEITDYLKTCNDFKIFIELLEPVFNKMDEAKQYYKDLENDLLFFKKSLEDYAKDNLCIVL